MSLKFEPLPATGNGKDPRATAAWLDELRQHQGEWARIPVGKTSAGSWKVRWGPRGFEFATRTIDGEQVVFGRFVGTEAK